jgi:hypothetical protein
VPKTSLFYYWSCQLGQTPSPESKASVSHQGVDTGGWVNPWQKRLLHSGVSQIKASSSSTTMEGIRASLFSPQYSVLFQHTNGIVSSHSANTTGWSLNAKSQVSHGGIKVKRPSTKDASTQSLHVELKQYILTDGQTTGINKKLGSPYIGLFSSCPFS